MEKKVIYVNRPTIKRKDLENVLESMVQEKIDYGDFAKHFEERLSNRTEVKHVVAINSLFNAFILLLDMLEVKEGDEVILPSFAPQVYLNAVLLKKAKPVLVDLEQFSLQPSLEGVKKAISSKTKTMVLIHYFGQYYDPSPFVELVPDAIQDISSIPGAKINEVSIAKITKFCISDFSSKSIITTGDGAAVFCDQKKYFAPLLSLIEKDYFLEYSPRYSCLMPDLNAALGISQDESFNKRMILREQIGKIYEEAVKKGHGLSFIQELNPMKLYSDFCVKVKSSLKETIKYFKKNSVEVERPYPYPLHQYLNLDKKDYPNTENYYLKSLLLPIHSTLLRKEVDLIVKIITSVC